MAREEYERNQEMWKLRHIDGWSLPAIGKKYGISRERVRQIIGNTGQNFRREWTEKLRASGRIHLRHYTDLKNAPGVKKVWQENWGSERHEARSGPVRVGQQFEELASQILWEHGIENKLMPMRCPYNLETQDGVRVAVQVTHRDAAEFESQNPGTSSWIVAHTYQWKNCDFFFVFLPDKEELSGYTYFVIPSHALQHLEHGTHIRIPWPASAKASKWHIYHGRIDLIKE